MRWLGGEERVGSIAALLVRDETKPQAGGQARSRKINQPLTHTLKC